MQSFYERGKRSFSYGLSVEEDGSCRTVERDPERPSSVGNEVRNYHARVDTLANERDNSFQLTVVREAFNKKTLFTTRIRQWMWMERENRVRLV